jgi:serine/threonine protein kinase
MSSLASLTTPRGKLTAKGKKKQASQLANRPASAHPSTSSSSTTSINTATTISANSVRPGAKLTPAAGATRPSKSKPEDYDIDADEGTDGYTRGGYHPVQIGDLYKNNRYTIVSKLGWGAFSTVWRAKDNHLSSSSTSSAHSTSSTTTFNSSLALPEVAIKIQKAAPQYRQSAQAEIAVLEHVGRSLGSSRHRADSEWYLSRLLDKFDLAGPHGNHVCMVFPVYGRTLLDAIRETEHRGLSYEQVKRLSHQLLTALAACHAAKVVHTDLKPENILFQRAASSPSFSFSTNTTHEFDQPIVVADFGNARLLAECTAGDAIQTRQYRAPEVILGQVYGCAADVWSLACILFEAATGEYLFDPQAGEGFTREEDHLALMQETLGRLPLAMSNSGDHAARYFTRKGVLKRVGPIDAKCESMEEGLLLTMQEHGLFADTKNKQSNKKNGWTMERATLFSKFLACMLRYDPQQRWTAIDLLARFAQFWPASSSSSTDALTGSTLTEKEDDEDELDEDEFEDDEFDDEEESDPVNAVNEMARLVNEVETMMLSCGKEWRAVELEGLQLVADLKSIINRAASNTSIHHA